MHVRVVLAIGLVSGSCVECDPWASSCSGQGRFPQPLRVAGMGLTSNGVRGLEGGRQGIRCRCAGEGVVSGASALASTCLIG